jgi:hypothetical protein
VRALIAFLVSVVIATGCSVERLPAPSGPSPTPNPSGAAESLAPEAKFDGFQAGLDRRLLVTADADRWLFGSLAAGWQPLGPKIHEATVDDTWGRITATTLAGGEIVVSTPDASGALREVYRTRDGADATTGASWTPDGSGLIVFNVSLGVRHVDPATGRASEVLPPEDFFVGPKTTGEIYWSPTGRTLVFVVCDVDVCHSQVAENHIRKAVVDDFVPGAIAGHWLVGYERQGKAAPLLLDVETGARRRVAAPIEGFWDAIALAENRFLVWGTSADGQVAFVLVDPEAGTDRPVANDPQIRRPIAELSTPDWVALSQMDSLWVPVGGTLDVLDFASGRFHQDVIAVPPAP